MILETTPQGKVTKHNFPKIDASFEGAGAVSQSTWTSLRYQDAIQRVVFLVQGHLSEVAVETSSSLNLSHLVCVSSRVCACEQLCDELSIKV